MGQTDPVVIAQDIQFVAHSGQQTPSHLHGADVVRIRLPLDPIALQAFFQNVHIEHGIVRRQQAARHQRLYLLPYLGKCRRVADGVLIDAGELNIEIVEMRFRIDK